MRRKKPRPGPLPCGSPGPRPAVPVTCLSAAQSAPAARRLAIQTAAPSACGEQGCICRSCCCVRTMEHRIVGPGPYRATRLVSERAGTRAMLSGPRFPGLPADRVLVRLRFSRAGRTEFRGGTCSGRSVSFLDVAQRKADHVWSPACRGGRSFVPKLGWVLGNPRRLRFKEPGRPR